MTIKTEHLKTLLGTAALGLLLVSGSAAAGIATTKHNLGGAITSNSNYVTDTGATDGSNQEICVFCHTPHGADTSAPAPLWNKNLAANGSAYSTYADLGTTTLDAQTAQVGSISIACLSCHDGTQAMDNILNAPGSGNLTDGGDTAGLGWNWFSPARVDGDGKLTGVANLSTDLKNDHPIGIQYAGGPSSVAPNKGNYGSSTDHFRDVDFVTLQSNTADGTEPSASTQWWVDTGDFNQTREKSDIILYTRNVTDATDVGTTWTAENSMSYQPFVECASCHDPHTDNALFLRVGTNGNQGSAVCLACHVK